MGGGRMGNWGRTPQLAGESMPPQGAIEPAGVTGNYNRAPLRFP